MRHQEAEGQLGGSGERPRIAEGWPEARLGVLARFERPRIAGVGLGKGGSIG